MVTDRPAPDQDPTQAVQDSPERSRFELPVGGLLAFADYRLADGRLTITHVETPEALRGSGVASRLMQGVVDAARSRGLKVAPVCPYAVAFFKRHPESQDLLYGAGVTPSDETR